MPLKPRNRIVNFRLTEQEYDTLKNACAVQGSRCVSEFARTAVLTLAHSGPEPGSSVQTSLLNLDRKLSNLGSGIYRLVELLETADPLTAGQAATRFVGQQVSRAEQEDRDGAPANVSFVLERIAAG